MNALNHQGSARGAKLRYVEGRQFLELPLKEDILTVCGVSDHHACRHDCSLVERKREREREIAGRSRKGRDAFEINLEVLISVHNER